jgi:hypothetical protein
MIWLRWRTPAKWLRLAVTPERARQLITARELDAQQTPTKRWLITRASVEKYRLGTVERTAESSSPNLEAEVQRPSEAVLRLEERAASSAVLLDAVSRERDRYRADAAAARGAAMEMQASIPDFTGVVQQLQLIIERQANALGQLLAPGSPEDLLRR